MRRRPVTGDEWTNYLKKLSVDDMRKSRDALRKDFCSSLQDQLKKAATTKHRKPSETWNDDGTPKDEAASALPPYPQPDTSSKSAAAESADRRGASLLSFSNFSGTYHEAGGGGGHALGGGGGGGGARKRQRRGMELQFSEGIRCRYQEVIMYQQLQELERKMDSISTRKRMQIEEALKHPDTCTARLEIVIWNTHENQPPASCQSTGLQVCANGATASEAEVLSLLALQVQKYKY
jgi:hypothetical protein